MNTLTTEEEFYLPVKMVETKKIVSINDTDVSTMSYNSHAVIVEKPEGAKIVNFCSNRYGLVDNSSIFPEIEKLLQEKYVFNKTYKQRDNCIFWADYVLEGKNMNIGNVQFEDEVKPLIRIMHSYNGSVRYKAVMGFRRQICSNGLWGYVFDTEVDLRHSIGNLKSIFEKTIESVESFIEKAGEFKLKYDEMTKHVIELPQLQEKVELIIEATNFPKKQKQAVLDRIKIESSSNNLPITNWLVYNAFNYQLNHNTEFTNDEVHRMKIDSKVLDAINFMVE